MFQLGQPASQPGEHRNQRERERPASLLASHTSPFLLLEGNPPDVDDDAEAEAHRKHREVTAKIIRILPALALARAGGCARRKRPILGETKPNKLSRRCVSALTLMRVATKHKSTNTLQDTLLQGSKARVVCALSIGAFRVHGIKKPAEHPGE